jgi:hypothetical protein
MSQAAAGKKKTTRSSSRKPGRFEVTWRAYHFMSATVRPAGINGRTCSVYGVMMSST